MNVNSIAAQQSLYLAQLNAQNSQTQNTAAASASSAGADATDLSDPAQFFSELKQLSQQDPADFKNITAQIAQQLSTAAQNSNDPNQAAFLKNLAANFQSASQTGDFSSLFPQAQAQAQAHGHHHHGYRPPSSSDSSSNTQDTLSSIFSSYAQQIESLLSSGAGSTATTASS